MGEGVVQPTYEQVTSLPAKTQSVEEGRMKCCDGFPWVAPEGQKCLYHPPLRIKGVAKNNATKLHSFNHGRLKFVIFHHNKFSYHPVS